MIVSDETVARHYSRALRDSLAGAGIAITSWLLPPGEETKDLDHFGRLAEEILAFGIERGDDLAGARRRRGRRPRRLRRGDTAARHRLRADPDHPAGPGGQLGRRQDRDQHAAARTWSAPSTSRGWCWPTPTCLATLPRREMRAGYAEVVKYGLLGDAGFFDWLEAEGRRCCGLTPAALSHAVARAAR